MTCTTVIDYIDIAYSDINVYKMKSIQSFLLLLMQFMAAGQTSKILILQSFNQDTCVYFTLICNKQKNMNGCHHCSVLLSYFKVLKNYYKYWKVMTDEVHCSADSISTQYFTCMVRSWATTHSEDDLLHVRSSSGVYA